MKTSDQTGSPREEARSRGQLALGVIVLVSLGVAFVVWASQRTTSRLVRERSDAFMEHVAERTRSVALDYLGEGASSLEAISELVRRGQLDLRSDDLVNQFRTHMLAHPQLEMFNLGSPDGSFLMVKRMPDGTLSTKRVIREGATATSTWTHENPDWASVEAFADVTEPAETAYDPRVRPWYRKAMELGTLTWAEPYVFYSDGQPGIACSLPLFGPSGDFLAVLGADIGISSLSGFLEQLEFVRGGNTAILVDDGRVIASTGRASIRAPQDSERPALDQPEVALESILEFPESPLASGYAKWNRESHGALVFRHDGKPHVGWFEPFALGAENDWIVGVEGPQSEFMGDLEHEQRLTLALTILSLFLAIAIAVILIRRSSAMEVAFLELQNSEKQRSILQLQSQNREIEAFAQSVSHDLKSPINTLSGFIGMLRRALSRDDAEGIDLCIQRIEANLTRMSRLVEALLRLGKVGRPINAPEKIAATELVNETLEQLSGLIHQRRISVTVAPDLPEIYGDPVRLHQLFQNLIENAIKFMGEQEQPTVEIGGSLAGDTVTFWVRDNGAGIERDELAAVFEPFRRLDAEVPGTGLGLATVRRIVEVHGGRIWAESDGPGHGSTFRLELPRSGVGEDQAAA